MAAKRSPILGYNHNVRYRGVIFHVQTEDSGQQNPHLFTHLFHEGVIVSTRKYVYDASANEDAIKGLMQAQHKAVMKDLRKGTFDDKIDQYLSAVPGLEPRGTPGSRAPRAATEESPPPDEVGASGHSLSSGAPVAIEIVNEDLSSPIELPVKPRTKTAERTSKSRARAQSAPPPPPDDAPTELTRSPVVRFQTPPPTLGANLRESNPILELTIDHEDDRGRGPRDTAVEALIDPGKTIPVQQPRPASHGAAALPPMKAPTRPSMTPPVVTSRAPIAPMDDELSQPVEIYAPAPPSADPPPGERSERASQYSISRKDGAAPIREKTGRIQAVNPNAIPSGLGRPRPITGSMPTSNKDTGGQRAVPPNVPREGTPGNRPPPTPIRPSTPGPQQPGRVHVTAPIANRPSTPAAPQAGSGVVMTRPAVIVGAPPKPPANQPSNQRVRKAREEEGRGFGQGLISEKSLDEVILAYLSEDAEEK